MAVKERVCSATAGAPDARLHEGLVYFEDLRDEATTTECIASCLT